MIEMIVYIIYQSSIEDKYQISRIAHPFWYIAHKKSQHKRESSLFKHHAMPVRRQKALTQKTDTTPTNTETWNSITISEKCNQ